MDCKKIGNLIAHLRHEKGYTQKQLADKLRLSDKAVSKWERGLGCPDISILTDLSDILGVDLQDMLNGSLPPNDLVGGNMKKSKFYVCPQCGNISVCTGQAQLSCCGRILTEAQPQKADAMHDLTAEIVEDDWFISSEHEMTKDHFISFVAFVTGDRVQLIKQYPEWNLQVRIPKRTHGTLVWHCTKDGLFYKYI